MKVALLTILVLLPVAAIAQEEIVVPKAELFGGYGITFLDDFGNIDGWNAAVTINPHKVVGIKLEGSGLYGKDTQNDNIGYSAYSFMVGPQFSFRQPKVTPFVHALVGVVHWGVSGSFFGLDVGDSLNAFAFALGGGVDWHPGRRFGWRVAQVDYNPWYNEGSAHNVRISTGLVVRF